MNKSPKHIRLLKMEIPETGTSSVVKEHHLPAASMHAPCSLVCSSQPSPSCRGPRRLGAIRVRPEHPCTRPAAQDPGQGISSRWLRCQASHQQRPAAPRAGPALSRVLRTRAVRSQCLAAQKATKQSLFPGFSPALSERQFAEAWRLRAEHSSPEPRQAPCPGPAPAWVGAASTWCPEPSAGTRQGGPRTCPLAATFPWHPAGSPRSHGTQGCRGDGRHEGARPQTQSLGSSV